MTIAKAVARAWTDEAYKARLKSDPHTALSEVGVDVPAGIGIKVVEDTAQTTHVVLPEAPDNAGEMSDEELAKVAGGYPASPGG